MINYYPISYQHKESKIQKLSPILMPIDKFVLASKHSPYTIIRLKYSSVVFK